MVRLVYKNNFPLDLKRKCFFLALEFEHKGWQSKQCEFFADVFTEAIKNGLPAIQTQHPGLYYQQVK